MTTREASGRCLCGAVRFTAREVAAELHACHCGMCRRWAGGPDFGVNAGALECTGEENLTVYDSSEWVARAFCKICGGHLFFHIKQSDSYVLCAGALDDDGARPLASEMYIDEKPAFYDFAGERPRMTGAEFLASIGVEAED